MIDSPCVRRCCLDDKDICIGCLRSLSEIRGWSQADEPSKKRILANVERRKANTSLKLIP
ncbi:DUF1289 domain-containing protein [Neptunomonas phycophila]|uniref:DUF1289 domain-containing protein n=1 Tax=Neptunomonas phycophila TaxID=1572645 RepID=UPI0026E1C213|nr:DUF1289 domain-containing protein [Neptunomonas phycophila]MDO6468734.1 DUF1289 domain-containing protein [Neptunomonas phycophila]